MKRFLFLLVVAALVVIPTLSVQAETQPCVDLQSNLQYGDTDANDNGPVRALQGFLINKYGALSGLDTATGYFGRLTMEGVKYYQTEKGITPVSGYVGPLTRQTIRTETCTTPGQIATTTINDFQIASTYMVASTTNSAINGFYACGTGFTNNMFASLFWTSPSNVRQQKTPVWYVQNSVSTTSRLTLLTDSTGQRCAFLPMSISDQSLLNQGWTTDTTLYNSDTGSSLEVAMTATTTPIYYQIATTTSNPLTLSGLNRTTVPGDGITPVIATGAGININTKVYLGTGGNKLAITPKTYALYAGNQLTFTVPTTLATGTYLVSLSNDSLVFATSTPASNLIVTRNASSVIVPSIVSTEYTDTHFKVCGTNFDNDVYASVAWTSSAGVAATSSQVVWYTKTSADAYKISTSTNPQNQAQKCASIPFGSAAQSVLFYWTADFTLYNYLTGQYDSVQMPTPTISDTPFILNCSVSTSTANGTSVQAVFTASTTSAGNYTYTWTGDLANSVSNTSSSTTQIYSNKGQRVVNVRVNKVGLSNNAQTCSMVVNLPKTVNTTVIYPSCGTFANQTVATSTNPKIVNPSRLCIQGELDEGSFGYNADNKWYWSCVGQNTIWPNDAIWCFTPRATTMTNPVGGVCGSANGVQRNSAPTSGLCNQGTASQVTGSGPWNWTCSGANNGSMTSCSAPKVVSWPTCGTFATGAATSSSPASQPSSALCATGNFGNVSGWNADNKWYWSCVDSSNNTSWCFRPRTANSPAATDGACGPAVNSSSATQPVASTLCLQGNAGTVSSSQTAWSWTCSASNGGIPASCTVNKSNSMPQQPGECGSADDATLSTAPSGSALCDNGLASAVSSSATAWSWTCDGIRGSTVNDSCSATKEVIWSECGPAENVPTATQPTLTQANLCDKGTYVTGSMTWGPDSSGANVWAWNCRGTNTGWADEAYWCYAPKLASASAKKTSFFGAVVTSIADLFR